MARADTVPLGKLVTTIRPGPPNKLDKGVGIDVWEVSASDLPPFGYIKTPSKTVMIDPQAVRAKQFLLPFDIVLIVKGSVGKLGIVPINVPSPGPGGWVAGSSAIVLRGERFSPMPFDLRALAMQLRSPLGQALLGGIVSGGATMHMINLHELNRLAVLLPSPQEAEMAVSALEEEAHIQRSIDRLHQQQADIASKIWSLK